MDTSRFDLARVLAIAEEVVRPGVSARLLASSLGRATDLFGRGNDWGVDSPSVAGVHSVVVIGSGDFGPESMANVVLIGFAKSKGPALRELQAVMGKGTVVTPVDWQPWRWTYEGPSSDSASVLIVVSTDAVTGDEEDPLVTEIALRRSQRLP